MACGDQLLIKVVIVLLKADKGDLLQRWQKGECFLGSMPCDFSGVVFGKTIDASADIGEGNRGDAMLPDQLKAAAIGGG